MKIKKISILSSILVVIAVQSCVSLRSNNNRNDLQKDNVLGQVKKTKTILYRYDEDIDSLRTFSIDYYNKQGYVIEHEMHQLHDNIEYYRYILDSKNDVIEERKFNTNNILTETKIYSYKYNDKGDKIEIKEFNESGQLDYKIIFDRKHKENIETVTKKIFLPDGSLDYKMTVKIKHNTKQDQILESRLYDRDGNLDFKIDYKYDDKGNEIETAIDNRDGEIKDKFTYKYVFDEHKNWIKKIEHEHGKPTRVTEREITYYE